MTQPSDSQSPEPPRRRWGRSHLIWLLLALSLVPGLFAGAAPEAWATLSQPVRAAAYVVSGLLIAAGVGMIVTSRD
jgi:hypothetical protein